MALVSRRADDGRESYLQPDHAEALTCVSSFRRRTLGTLHHGARTAEVLC